MDYYSSQISKLIEELSRLPGIGAKSAGRLAFHIINMPKEQVEQLAATLVDARNNVRYCKQCCTLTDKELCPICASEERDHKTIMVVENSRDLAAYEKTGKYNGVYHVLHGAISPMLGIGPGDIRLKELMERLQGDVDEVIIATNSSLEGETTAMYISKLIKPTGIKVSRIASGVPVGGDLEYIYDRHERRCARPKRELGLHAIRGGTITGEHTILFAGQDEVVELTHQAYSRRIYAVGALRAAQFICKLPCGLYDMSSLLTQQQIITHAYASESDVLITVSSIKDPALVNNIFIQLKDAEIIIDIISQHHGNTMVSYFYYKAKKLDPDVKEDDFRYMGKRPQTREAAILMIADTVEAAVRSSINHLNHAQVAGFIRNLINDKMNDKQFIECNLTYRDLNEITDEMIRMINSMYHKRVAYPDKKSLLK